MHPTTIPGIARCALALACCSLLAACSATAPVMRQAEDLVQGVMVKTRGKGEKQLVDPATVARELACGTRGATPARMEVSEVLPERPRPGREISHRVVLASCPLPADAMAGTLTRRVTYLGRTLFEDSEPYTLKPGRWSVDVFIGIPPQATPGPYRLAVRFARRGMQLDAGSDFTVVAP